MSDERSEEHSGGYAGAGAGTRPNVVWFVADQMRCDSIAHMGNPAAVTPNLDSLAEEGASFENAYCQNPVCVPSRCSFLSGLYPHALGHRTMHFLQRPEDPNILRTMKQAGYEVVWIGRNDVLPGPASKEEYCDLYFDGTDLVDKHAQTGGRMRFARPSAAPEVPEVMRGANLEYSFYLGRYPEHSLDETFDWKCLEAALRYLDGRGADESACGRRKPFFLYCTLAFPHPPYGCEDPWFSMIDRSALPPRRPNVELLPDKPAMLRGIRKRQAMGAWTEPQFDEMRATYLGMVARWDHMLGLVCAKLRERGLYEDTSVFAFSDHGDLTGDYGIAEKCQNCFEDPLTRVPLVIKPAQGIPVRPGVHVEPVELVDLPATVADMAGVELEYVQAGGSLVPALDDGPVPHDAVFSEGGRIHGEWQAMEPEHGPESPYWPRISLQHEEGPAHTKACMVRMGSLKYVRRLYEHDQLYDLAHDPMELQNLVDDPSYAADLARLKDRLLAFYLETGDYVPPKMDKR